MCYESAEIIRFEGLPIHSNISFLACAQSFNQKCFQHFATILSETYNQFEQKHMNNFKWFIVK